nr:NECAP protein CG9132 [Hymenolepis microstoma]
MRWTYQSCYLFHNSIVVEWMTTNTNPGYRAADWSLDAPIWSGRLKVITKSTKNTLYIRLEDGTSGVLYAQCPVESFPSEAVEQVLDSSRYFVIRLVSDDGRSVLVGIGFAGRSDAFDLNVAIQDHFKHVKQAAEAERIQAQEALGGSSTSSHPKLDLGLKEGQKLRLNLNTRRSGDTDGGSNGPGSTRSRPIPSLKLGDPLGPGLIPPPPGPAITGNRNRQAFRGTVEGIPEVTPSTKTDSAPKSNIDLLADIFQSSTPQSAQTASTQNPNDFSLL